MSVRVASRVLLVLAVPVWTWLLLEPNPVPAAVKSFLGFWDWAAFLVAKTLHAGVYATLALLAWCAAPAGAGRRWRQLALGLLVLHAAGTEVGQTYVPGRTGTVKDVVIDAVGIAAGVLLGRQLRP